jgi:hypothetical protein
VMVFAFGTFEGPCPVCNADCDGRFDMDGCPETEWEMTCAGCGASLLAEVSVDVHFAKHVPEDPDRADLS